MSEFSRRTNSLNLTELRELALRNRYSDVTLPAHTLLALVEELQTAHNKLSRMGDDDSYSCSC